MKKLNLVVLIVLFCFSCNSFSGDEALRSLMTQETEYAETAVSSDKQQTAEDSFEAGEQLAEKDTDILNEIDIRSDEQTLSDSALNAQSSGEATSSETASGETASHQAADSGTSSETAGGSDTGIAANVETNIDTNIDITEFIAEVLDNENYIEEDTNIDISQYISEISDRVIDTEPAPAQTQQTQPPAQTQQTQPPAQTQHTQPPAQTQHTQPPAQTQHTQPPAQTQQTQPPAQTQQTQPPAQTQQTQPPDTPSGPATRLDSLTQMGMTPLDSDIVYSRIVRATVGQILEIPFRGTGWVFLGELASRRGIVYNSRRNDPDGLSFIFSLEEAGTYTLKFYRQDFIRDFIINDHVQVIVGEAPSAGTGWFGPPVDRGRVIAQPRWPSAAEEAQIRSGTRPATEPVITGTIPAQPAAEQQDSSPQQTQQQQTNQQQTNQQQQTQLPPVTTASVTSPQETNQQTANTQTSPQTEEIAPAPVRVSPDVLLQRAKDTFEGGNVPAAIQVLDQFMEFYPGGSDEVYWLLGQFYEANSPSRNILLSLEYYRKLTNEYPQSRRFDDARRRIAYLERFYINIQ